MVFLKVLRRRMTIFVGISTAKSTGGMLQQTSSSWKSRGEYWEKEKEKEPSTPTQRKGSPIGWRVAKRHLQEKYKEFQHLHNYTLNLHNCPLSQHNSLLNLQIYLMNLLTKNWWMKAHWRRKKLQNFALLQSKTGNVVNRKNSAQTRHYWCLALPTTKTWVTAWNWSTKKQNSSFRS